MLIFEHHGEVAPESLKAGPRPMNASLDESQRDEPTLLGGCTCSLDQGLLRTPDELEDGFEWPEVVAAMPQIMWITRPDGYHVYFNQQWMDFTGLTLVESLGDGWNPPFHADEHPLASVVG